MSGSELMWKWKGRAGEWCPGSYNYLGLSHPGQMQERGSMAGNSLHLPPATLFPIFSSAGDYSETSCFLAIIKEPRCTRRKSKGDAQSCTPTGPLSCGEYGQVRPWGLLLCYLAGLSVALNPAISLLLKPEDTAVRGRGVTRNLLLYLPITCGLYQEPVSTLGSVITQTVYVFCERGSAYR